MSTSGIPLQSAQNPQQPDEDLLAMLGLHPAQMQVAHGLASGAIHPQDVLDAATPKPPLQAAENPPPSVSLPGEASPSVAAPAPDAVKTAAASPASVAPPPVLSGQSASPRIAPSLPPQAPTRLSEDQSELQRLDKTGSGLQQFQQRHPVLGTIARIGAGVGSAMFPGIAANIPGTDLHHSVLVNQARGRVGEDLGEQEKTAQTGEVAARTAHEDAATDALKNPPEKVGTTPEAETLHDLMTGENGHARVNPDTGKPYQYLEAFQKVYQAKQDTKPDKPEKTPTFEEQTYTEWKQTHPNGTRMQFDAQRKANERAPEKEPHQLVVTPDGTVLELKPGMKVPQGSKTVTGDLNNKPTADEQRRSDLSENLNENLDQLTDIVKRRPELFGPLAGRWTQLKAKFGSDDPDVAALQTIEHQLGMAQISAHGMRSAQGIQSAADSIVNGLHSGPAALLHSIETVRSSVKTFTADVEKGKSGKESGGAGGEQQAASGGELTPPKDPDPGMKWQHRTVAGQTEWRQVKQ